MIWIILICLNIVCVFVSKIEGLMLFKLLCFFNVVWMVLGCLNIFLSMKWWYLFLFVVLLLLVNVFIGCLICWLLLFRILIDFWCILVIFFFFKNIKWVVIGSNVSWFDVIKFLFRLILMMSGLFWCVVII